MRPLITASRMAASLIPLSCASDEMVWPVLVLALSVLALSVLALSVFALSVFPLSVLALVGWESEAGGFSALVLGAAGAEVFAAGEVAAPFTAAALGASGTGVRAPRALE